MKGRYWIACVIFFWACGDSPNTGENPECNTNENCAGGQTCCEKKCIPASAICGGAEVQDEPDVQAGDAGGETTAPEDVMTQPEVEVESDADINACTTSPCGANATCIDLPAPAAGDASGRTCQCNAGYEGNAVTGCTDIDACTTSPCGANATCTDLPAPAPGDASGRTCRCNAGYEDNSESGSGCVRIPIDGACGVASGGSSVEPPGVGLCARGVASAVTGSGPYDWWCAGEHGGTTANCTANRSCAASNQTWTVSGFSCRGDLAVMDHGESVTATDTSPPTTGSRGYTCAQGTWTAAGMGTCTLETLLSEMVYIPPGTFVMGSPMAEHGRSADETQHSVTLTRGIYMQTTEVTQGQWKALSGNVNPSCFQTAGSSSCSTENANDSAPVEMVNWLSVLGYANALSEAEGLEPCYAVTLTGCTGAGQPGTWQSGMQSCWGGPSSMVEVSFVGLDCTGYRLPTESEWEYAARAGTTTATYAGNLSGPVHDCTTAQASLEDIAWWCGNSSNRSHPVAGKTANVWGLRDMLGNVWEWVWDWWGTYPDAVTDPLGPASGTMRVYRGGSWNFNAHLARAAHRRYDGITYRGNHLGFRLCRTVLP